MKSLQKIYFILLIGAITSCTKVIDIKVRDSDMKYVIEGVITDQPGDCKVYLTRSRNFNEDNNFEKVSGASVKISDNGNSVALTESSPGVYQTSSVNGTPGHVYDLTVEVNGATFTSSYKMPQPVDMDSLYISKGPFGRFKFATIQYTDPAGTDNGYRFIQYVNGGKEPTIFWDDDEFTDGDMVINQLDASDDNEDDPRNIKSGDEVVVQMLTLDAQVLKYWRSLRSGGGSGETSSAAPANPLTNISGGALGYFSAHTIRTHTIISP